MVSLESVYKNPYGQNPFCVKIEECKDLEELLFKVRKYAETQTLLKSATINRAIRRLTAMANKKQEFPIDYFNLRQDQWIYNMTWYKENIYSSETGENFYGLKERKEAFYLLLEACGIPRSYFPYQLPSRPKHKPIQFPNPDKAYELTTYDFFDNKELDWYWQFAHLYNFIVEPRSPSEMAIMRIRWIDWDSCTIEFPQPKLHGEIRKIVLPEVFIKGKTRKKLEELC